MFGQLPPRSTGSLESLAGHQIACWQDLESQSFQQPLMVLLLGPELRTPKSSLFVSWGWDWFVNPKLLVSWYFRCAAAPWIGEKGENLIGLGSLTIFRPREAGRGATRKTDRFLSKFSLELKIFCRKTSNSEFSSRKLLYCSNLNQLY